MSIVEFLLQFLFLLSGGARGQELRPAVVVSNNEGVVRTEQVFFGFMGCNESSTNHLEELVYKQNETIKELKENFDQLKQVVLSLSNRTGTGLLQYNPGNSTQSTSKFRI